MDYRWLTIVGLGLDIVGAVVIAAGVVTTPEKARKVGTSYWGGGTETDSNLPPVSDRIRQSKLALWGIGLLALGFGLQIIAAWPRE